MQSRTAAERVYDEIAGDLGDRAALPRELTEPFLVLDKVVGNIRAHFPMDGQVGCIAATIEGSRVRGVHAGIGRVLVLRAGATEVESLVAPHFMHLVAHRMRVKLPADFDPARRCRRRTPPARPCSTRPYSFRTSCRWSRRSRPWSGARVGGRGPPVVVSVVVTYDAATGGSGGESGGSSTGDATTTAGEPTTLAMVDAHEALRREAALYGPDHPALADIHYDLARDHLHRGEPSSALSSATRALELDQRHHGVHSHEAAGDLQLLAEIHRRRGSLALADSTAQRAARSYAADPDTSASE
jgi:hypothetical protein